MTKKQMVEEWKKIKFEIYENRPKTDEPYPSDIVKRRQLLLYAQVHLAEISWAKKCRDLETERLQTDLYNLVMQNYYEWQK